MLHAAELLLAAASGQLRVHWQEARTQNFFFPPSRRQIFIFDRFLIAGRLELINNREKMCIFIPVVRLMFLGGSSVVKKMFIRFIHV